MNLALALRILMCFLSTVGFFYYLMLREIELQILINPHFKHTLVYSVMSNSRRGLHGVCMRRSKTFVQKVKII